MIGLMLKSVREMWGMALFAGLGFAAVALLFNRIIPDMQVQLLELWEQLPFVKTMIGALMGIPMDEGVTGRVFLAIIWTHPIVLTLIWAYEIIHCTRFPAGEVDRGTVDVLLGLPVSRAGVYVAETLTWLAGGAFVVGLGLAGNTIGGLFVDESARTPWREMGLILANLACLYVAVGGVVLLVSSLSDRRGRAIMVVVGVLIASFAWTFVGPFWEPAQRASFLSVLDYYRPALIVSRGSVPIGDLATLLGIGVVGWTAGLIVVRRRDICTV